MGLPERERWYLVGEGSRRLEVDLRALQDVLDTSVAVTLCGPYATNLRGEGSEVLRDWGTRAPSQADWAQQSPLACCAAPVNHTPSQKERAWALLALRRGAVEKEMKGRKFLRWRRR